VKISIIGAGYVGLVTAACFAEMGNTVYCVDCDEEKINGINNGIMPIYEHGLEDMVKHNIHAGQLNFTVDTQEALNYTDICFIAVGTPMSEDMGADLQYVFAAAKDIGRFMEKDLIVVNKSTVPVGTGDKVYKIISDELAARSREHKFHVVSNPEFLKEGNAIADCMSPDRVILGTSDKYAESIMRELYAPFIRNHDRFIVMDIKSAEMSKYAANAMLATRISFMNEIAGICESVGANAGMVRLGIGSDARIGYSFLYAGCGYGGSCFPKDIQALIKTARDNGCDADILEQVVKVNNRQKTLLVKKITKYFGDDLSGKVIAVWGLSFKPNTNDIREAPSIVIIEELLQKGAKIKAYDPAAMDEAKKMLGVGGHGVLFVEDKYKAIEDVDALVLVTEWKEFRSPDFSIMLEKMKKPVIFDGRNQYNAEILKKLGYKYFQIGVGE